MKIGVLLPHFGELASADRVLDTARRADELGFDSVWVRDHLVFKPHSFEGDSSFFLSPFETLAAVAAVTRRIKLGTSVAILVRHPLAIAQSFITVSQFAPDRVIAGIGAGNFQHEFEAAGISFDDRPGMLEDMLELLPRAFSGKPFSFDGRVFHIPDVQFEPGAAGSIPVIVGGNAPAAARRAVLCDGWLPGRIPFATFSRRYEKILELRDEAGIGPPIIGAMPLVSIDGTREAAQARVNVPPLLASANRAKYWVKPASGSFQTLEDLRGMVLAGTAEDVCEEIKEYERRGADFLILDFRSRFEELEEQMAWFAREVLPAFGGDL